VQRILLLNSSLNSVGKLWATPWLHYPTTTLNYILAHDLQTEFKEEFYKKYAASEHAAPIKMHKVAE
jgi:hypothetical protein